MMPNTLHPIPGFTPSAIAFGLKEISMLIFQKIKDGSFKWITSTGALQIQAG
jgi:hypothetical protein